MHISGLIEALSQHGIELMPDGGRLYFQPRGAATAEIQDPLKQHKQQLIDFINRQPKWSVLQIYDNPTGCHNPFTPHSTHEFPWECNPDTCYCYKEFGYPRFCQGVPCRWVWTNGAPNSEEKSI
ncbi:hypothetical protein ACFLX4_01200 [Chloroflexota bacterium]